LRTTQIVLLGEFSARPTEMKSLNSFFTKLRRQRGRTSPPLINIHPNPGPKKKATRHGVSKASNETHLSVDERSQILDLRAKGMSVADIARKIGRKEETVDRWIDRYEETGDVQENKPGRKRNGEHLTHKENRQKTVKRPKSVKVTQKLTDFKKGNVSALLDIPKSHRKIAAEVGCSHTTVDLWAKRKEEDPEMKRKSDNRPGPSRITSDRQNRILARRADASDEPSLRKMEQEMKDKKISGKVSRETIRRRLHEQDMDAYRQIPKPKLTKAQKKARLQWARKHENWTLEQWQRVLWSDESMFTRIPKIPRKFVWMRNSKPRHGWKRIIADKRVAPRVRGGGGKINVWGCFYAGGVGNLKEIHGNMNAEQYHGILVHHLLPLIRQKALAEPTHIAWVFQQDNCSTHTAKMNMEYLERKINESEHKWSLMEWPSNSPDLNPIENLWAYLKAQLRSYPQEPRTTQELMERLRVEWGKLGPKALENYVNDMPERIAAVIENKGGSTEW
jgi:transposase